MYIFHVWYCRDFLNVDCLHWIRILHAASDRPPENSITAINIFECGRISYLSCFELIKCESILHFEILISIFFLLTSSISKWIIFYVFWVKIGSAATPLILNLLFHLNTIWIWILYAAILRTFEWRRCAQPRHQRFDPHTFIGCFIRKKKHWNWLPEFMVYGEVYGFFTHSPSRIVHTYNHT